MDEINALIPRGKGDHEAVERIKNADPKELEPVLDGILEWLQDWCWPIAGPLADALKPLGILLAPHLRRILRSNDGTWKHHVMGAFVSENKELCMALKDDLERIAHSPTSDDKLEEVDELAKDILESHRL